MRQVLLLSVLCSAAVQAAEDPDRPWSGKAALGVLATSGNSETTNANLGLELKYDSELWHHIAQLAAAGADSEGQTTAERYKASYKAKRDFSEHNYLFGLVNYEKDKFSGYDRQISETIGYGRRLLEDDRHVLNLEAGVGFKQSDLRDGTSENGAIVRLASDYLLNISPTAQFTQEIGIEQGSGNTYLESISAIRATLIEQLGLVLSFTIKTNSDVPAGSEKTDTFTAISLEYGF